MAATGHPSWPLHLAFASFLQTFPIAYSLSYFPPQVIKLKPDMFSIQLLEIEDM